MKISHPAFKNMKTIVTILVSILLIIGSILSVLLLSDKLDSWVGLDSPYKFSGILSGIFAGLAFLGVLYSLRLQISSSKQQKMTNELQRFENTLFNMLNMHQEVIKAIRCVSYEIIKQETNDPNKGSIITTTKNKVIIEGKEAFEYLFRKQIIFAPNENVSWKGLQGSLKMKGIKEGYGGLSAYPLQTYFKHLYRIVKFIDDPRKVFLTDSDRYEYISDNVRSTLSSYELYWIYYHCLSNDGNVKFKPLVEKYSLLKNINTRGLVRSKDCEEYRIKNNPNLPDMISNIRKFPFNDYEFFLSTVKEKRTLFI